MIHVFDEVKKQLPKMTFADDLMCFIVFGSSVVNANKDKKPGDCDICVVVKNRDVNLKKIANFIFSYFNQPDYRIYFMDEIESSLPHMDYGVGVFSIEYFAHGRSLFGENIFKELLVKTDKEKLKESYLNKISEYIIRIRRAYISPNNNSEYKYWHTYKYVLRLMIDILLYKEIINYGQMLYTDRDEILTLCKKIGLVSERVRVDFSDTESIYKLFEALNKSIIKPDPMDNSKTETRLYDRHKMII